MHLSIYPLSIPLTTCASIHAHICHSIYLSIHLPIYPSIPPFFIHPTNHPPTHASIYSSVHPSSNHPSIQLFACLFKPCQVPELNNKTRALPFSSSCLFWEYHTQTPILIPPFLYTVDLSYRDRKSVQVNMM